MSQNVKYGTFVANVTKNQHTRYEQIILGRIRCEEAPQVVPACCCAIFFGCQTRDHGNEGGDDGDSGDLDDNEGDVDVNDELDDDNDHKMEKRIPSAKKLCE